MGSSFDEDVRQLPATPPPIRTLYIVAQWYRTYLTKFYEFVEDTAASLSGYSLDNCRTYLTKSYMHLQRRH